MGILDKAKEFAKSVSVNYDKYRQEAPARDKKKLESLKMQRERLKIETEISDLRFQKTKKVKARYGFGSESPERFGLGVPYPDTKPNKSGSLKPKDLARKPKRRIIEEY